MPQLNPEFFVSQLFWLLITFVFLFIFLWRISLPRISSVLDKRSSKINDDIKKAKQHQAEAEEIQLKIDKQIADVKLQTSELIKDANSNFQKNTSNSLDALDKTLNSNLDKIANEIKKAKSDSLLQINDQIFEITKINKNI